MAAPPFAEPTLPLLQPASEREETTLKAEPPGLAERLGVALHPSLDGLWIDGDYSAED